jgi:hypothetical protein
MEIPENITAGTTLMKALDGLGPREQKYARDYFIAGLSMDAWGFTRPQREKPFAEYALKQLAAAIDAAKRSKVENDWPDMPSI